MHKIVGHVLCNNVLPIFYFSVYGTIDKDFSRFTSKLALLILFWLSGLLPFVLEPAPNTPPRVDKAYSALKQSLVTFPI